ncbi:GNAT family N-acetyltransferase [Calothrix sp. HK-06]|nr:GNAT family N-acetyltransferase [Calothrix sp. HK-06]
MESKITLRQGRPLDAHLCALICYEAFNNIADKHNFPRYFTSLQEVIDWFIGKFKNQNVYSIIAEIDGQIVASNFLKIRGDIAGVGPVTVAPNVQNDSVGRRLMENVLEYAQQKGSVSVRLVQAGYDNRSLALYTKLGFNIQEPLVVIQGNALNLEISGYQVRSCTQDDINACNQLCFKVHGCDRQQELIEAVKRLTANVVVHDGQITGYSSMAGFYGYAVGKSNEELKALIGAATSFVGLGFILPTRNSELFRWCLEKGLRVVAPMNLMTFGLYNEPKGAFLPSIFW